MYRRLVQAKLFIDAQYASDIDLENISGEACLSKFHFVRLFRKIYGKTPHQYLIAVRIEKAKTFLGKGCTAAESCHAVGFDSIGSFTTLFKKITGLTPIQFQQEQLKLKKEMTTTPLRFVPHCFTGFSQKSNFQEA